MRSSSTTRQQRVKPVVSHRISATRVKNQKNQHHHKKLSFSSKSLQSESRPKSANFPKSKDYPHAIAFNMGAPWLNSDINTPTSSKQTTSSNLGDSRKYENLIKCANPKEKAALRESHARVVYEDIDGFDPLLNDPINDVNELPQIPARADLTSTSCNVSGSSNNNTHINGRVHTPVLSTSATNNNTSHFGLAPLYTPTVPVSINPRRSISTRVNNNKTNGINRTIGRFFSTITIPTQHHVSSIAHYRMPPPKNMTDYQRLTSTHGLSAQQTSLDDSFHVLSQHQRFKHTFHFPVMKLDHKNDMYGAIDRQTVPQSENGLENYASGINFDGSLYTTSRSRRHITPKQNTHPHNFHTTTPGHHGSIITQDHHNTVPTMKTYTGHRVHPNRSIASIGSGTNSNNDIDRFYNQISKLSSGEIVKLNNSVANFSPTSLVKF